MITEYTSPRSFVAETIFPLVIPEHSQILSIVVESLNNNTGTLTLQTTPVNADESRRIIFIDDISEAGIYTGNSSMDYFTHKQNLVVKIIGSLEIIVTLLFWEIGR